MEEKKMKTGVIVRPHEKKEWTIFILMIASIMLTISPVVNLYNVPTLVLGMPVFLFVSLLTLLTAVIVINLAYKWGVK